MPAVKNIVARHFRTRKGPRWPFYMHGTPWMEINNRGNAVAKADALLHNRFRQSWPPFEEFDLNKSGGTVDWDKGYPGLGGTISRTTFLVELTTAFALTGKVVYIEKARDLLRSYVDGYPFILEPG